MKTVPRNVKLASEVGIKPTDPPSVLTVGGVRYDFQRTLTLLGSTVHIYRPTSRKELPDMHVLND